MVSIATNRTVDRNELDEFIRTRHQGVLLTTRRDGRPQSSLVTMGLDTGGCIVVSSYPERAKVANIRRNPLASIVVMSDDFGGEWVHIDAQAEIVDLPEAVEGLVEYFRVISGDHPNWAEYRQAMDDQGKCLIRLHIERWGPIATGGFPPKVAARM
ncbi:MAG: PPOX class F420-dependent oxidoreductase [Actinomycetia bacterium]|nr:PPOX class F420-dependent oxidoreductase [Actinomycetes bacterium]